MKKIFMTLTVMLLGIVMMLAPNAYAVSNPENSRKFNSSYWNN